MKRSLRLQLVLIALVVGLAGCAHRSMKTARQLDEGQNVWSGSLTIPGQGIFPKIGGRWVRGVGSGDVTAFGGASVHFFDIGGGYRHYLGSRTNLDFEGRYVYTTPEAGGGFDTHPAGLADSFVGHVAVTSSTSPTRTFYLGGQLMAGLRGPVSSASGRFSAGSVGLLIGHESAAHANPGFQFEALISPVGIKYVPSTSIDEPQIQIDAPLSMLTGTQISFGANWY